MMKQGETVTIYEDPITCQKSEGKAKLVRRIMVDGDLEYWEVESLGEHFRRWIKKETSK
jgi:hypothetical protein